MWKQKGQGIVEYALILAFVVGIGGVLFANGNLADSIRSVFSNVNTLTGGNRRVSGRKSAQTPPPLTFPHREDGRYDGRYKDLAKELKEDPDSGRKVIASDSDEGKKLAKELNIQTPEGDGWFVNTVQDGTYVVIYYSAAENKGKTYSALKEDFTNHPENYSNPVRVQIDEGGYNKAGDPIFYYPNTAGHVEPVSRGKGFSIYSGIH